MNATRLDLSVPRGPCYPSSTDDIAPLHLYLVQLVGEPFQFARVSYADELTMHFGALHESRSPKLKDRRYGAYVLSFRGSKWLIKSGPLPVIFGSSLAPTATPEDDSGGTVDQSELESGGLITAGAVVVFATPFYWKSYGGIGVHLVLSDGSAVTILPSPAPTNDDPYPELASWELLTTLGNLKVGPGAKWEFTPQRQVACTPPTGTISFPLYFKGKAAGVIHVPADLNDDDVRAIELTVNVIKAYAAQKAAS